MFQRFTSLFFSDSSTPEDLEEPKPFVSEEEEEDGWLIIDLPEAVSGSLGLHSLPRGGRERRNGSLHQNPPVHLLERLAPLPDDVPASVPPTLQDSYASASSKERWVGEKDSVCTSHCRHGSPPPTTSSPHSPSDCVSRSMPSQPDPCLMDESWFVTPPPCFTAEGPNPVSMESNPMEDLLIEHPSMSVYVTSTSIVVERETPEEHIGESEVPDRRLQRHAPHHSTSLATKAAILEKVNQVRRIQRAKHLAEKHKFSQKVMQRQNRTRECRPRRAKHQGSFVYQPCQRQYNY